MLILNIGCGYLPKHELIKGENIINVDIRKDANFIKNNCSVINLPFKNNSFDIVYCSHLLEHIENPYKALTEIKRVAKNKVIIKIPNASYFKFKSSGNEHLFSWTPFTLRNFLKLFFNKVEIYTTKKYISGSYIKKIIFAISCIFIKDNEIKGICYKYD